MKMNRFNCNRTVYILHFLLLMIAFSASAENNNSSYYLEAEISSDMSSLQGNAQITYRNTGSQPLNAIIILADCQRLGNLEIKQIKDQSDRAVEFVPIKIDKISPPLIGKTLFTLKLDNQLNVKDTVTFSVQFAVENIKRDNGTVSFLDNLLFGGNCWYPRVITLEGDEWKYLLPDAPSFDVSIRIPSETILIASKEEESVNNSDGISTYFFKGTAMRGFSFIASEELHSVSGELEEITIKSFFSEEEKPWGIRIASLAHETIEFYVKKFGFYPVERINLVANLPVEPESLSLDGIILLPASFTEMVKKWGFNFSLNFSQWLIAHSLAQQYWGLYVTETSAYPPWITSSLSLYSDREYLRSINLDSSIYYNYLDFYMEAAQRGVDTNLLQPLGLLERRGYDWQNILARGKGLAIINMLEFLLGKNKVESIAKQILQNFSYSTITSEDFVRICRSNSGQSLEWFFPPWLNSSARLDYAIGEIESRESKGEIISKIEILRQSDAQIPMPVRITLSNGEQIMQQIKGVDEKEELIITDNHPVYRVELDPEQLLPDINYANNYAVVTAAGNKEPLFPIDDYYEIGELSFNREFISQGLYFRDDFQLEVTNKKSVTQGLGIVILVQKAGWRRAGKRTVFISLRPNETKLIKDYYLLPDAKGKFKIIVSFYKADSLEEFKSFRANEVPDLKSAYIIYLK